MVDLRSVYFDESGTHAGSPALAIAGYVFEQRQAHRFERDWTKELARFGLPFAHMTDCATGNQHYKALTLEDRIASEKALIGLVRHRSLFGIALGVDFEHYKRLFGKSRFDHSAYTFALTACVRGVHEWARATGYSGKFEYIFEAGHVDAAEADQVMKAIQGSDTGTTYHSHAFVDKIQAMPLQAADMLAWQYAHFLKRRRDGHANMRADFLALLRRSDRLVEFGPDILNQWRGLMDDLNEEVIERFKELVPDPEAIAYAETELRRR